MKRGLATVGVVLLVATAALAQKPVRNVNPSHHPNLAAAQKFASDAYQKLVAAQQANEFDMKGHAQKAKELLEQVNNEIKLAAEAANENKH